jgi:cytidine deaminase
MKDIQRDNEDSSNPQNLVRIALEAKKNAYAPYSGFHVGAAVLVDDGRIFAGCNVENASYGGTVCAERIAIFKAISEGAKEIKAIAISSDSNNSTLPCGLCRQVMVEFASLDTPVYCSNNEGDFKSFVLGDLFPHPFKPSDMTA